MTSSPSQISAFLQRALGKRQQAAVTAVDAARWLDTAGLLKDSPSRPGKPLRDLLRQGVIVGQRQDPNGRWFIDRVADSQGLAQPAIHAGSVASASSLPATNSPTPTPTVPAARLPSSRSTSDEAYVLDLCDEALGRKASRQHTFPWLLGDVGRNRRGKALPVDGYYPDLGLVVEYREIQHAQSVPFFDRRQTLSGVGRGEQRRIYDRRREEAIPKHGLTLVVITPQQLDADRRGRLRRDRPKDLVSVRRLLSRWTTASA